MQVEVSVTNMWGKIFVVIMQVGVSVKLCKWYFLQCIMYMTVSIVLIQASVSIIGI